jgi:hypothetical protein
MEIGEQIQPKEHIMQEDHQGQIEHVLELQQHDQILIT